LRNPQKALGMPKKAAIPRQTGRSVFADRRTDPARKREAILRTAAQLFLEESYRRTSLDRVAQRLSITKPALYHYFGGKEQILLECCRLGISHITETLNRVASGCGSGLEKVELFIHSYVSAMTATFGRVVIRLDEGDLSPAARAEVRARKREIDRRLRSFIQEGIKDGSIAPCDPRIAAFSIAGAVNWICTCHEAAKTASLEEMASECARTLTRGLARRANQELIV
jgi:AcrR family transcriptional regulator